MANCFELFRQIELTAPVIFTTAYDEYMQQAFKLHSIDYLLKPIDESELFAAFQKYSNLQAHFQKELNSKLAILLNGCKPFPTQGYKSRFLIKTGDRLASIPVTDVVRLQADDRIVWLYEKSGARFIVDESLDQLEKLLDPSVFFRLNRGYIVPITSIERIEHHFNGRLHITLKNCNDSDLFVSREKAKAFRIWLGGQ
jgi:DNA-binding LytR/AlgR family response regulator